MYTLEKTSEPPQGLSAIWGSPYEDVTDYFIERKNYPLKNFGKALFSLTLLFYICAM